MKRIASRQALRILLILLSFLMSVSAVSGQFHRLVKNGSTESFLKIMPLGDSITYGECTSDSIGYRRSLYHLLTGSGYAVDFVGSWTTGYLYDFDRDHEGHPGWRADQVRDHVYEWLTWNPADMILLHIGTNDISGNNENVWEVSGILDEIDRFENDYSSTIKVFLARIMLRTDGKADQTIGFNNDVEGMAQNRINNGDDIVMVDMQSQIDTSSEMCDALHPDLAGYDRMAHIWYDAIVNALPVELSSFSYLFQDSGVLLQWRTESETDNYGFDIEKSEDGLDFYKIGFVPGQGTAESGNEYSFADPDRKTGHYYYRLKQIDFDGAFSYSDIIEVDVLPTTITLEQNYPNPFNSQTAFTFSVPETQFVTLKVYNSLGEEIKRLVEEDIEAGTHKIIWNADEMNSGIYYYRLITDNIVLTKKLSILK